MPGLRRYGPGRRTTRGRHLAVGARTPWYRCCLLVGAPSDKTSLAGPVPWKSVVSTDPFEDLKRHVVEGARLLHEPGSSHGRLSYYVRQPTIDSPRRKLNARCRT
jgi:hypothetical protein